VEKRLKALLYIVLVIYLPQENFVDIYLQKLHITDALNMPIMMIKINQTLEDLLI